MTLVRAPEQEDVWQTTGKYGEGKLSPTSIYGLLHRECHRLFPDDSFADLFRDIGRRSVPPRIVAVVMALQRLDIADVAAPIQRELRTRRWAGVDAADSSMLSIRLAPRGTTRMKWEVCSTWHSSREESSRRPSVPR